MFPKCTTRTFDFDKISSIPEINFKAEAMDSILLQKYQKHFLFKTIVVGDNSKPWIDQQIKALIKTQYHFHLSGELASAEKTTIIL
jgi:lysine/ornithine N-monooxygenase